MLIGDEQRAVQAGVEWKVAVIRARRMAQDNPNYSICIVNSGFSPLVLLVLGLGLNLGRLRLSVLFGAGIGALKLV